MVSGGIHDLRARAAKAPRAKDKAALRAPVINRNRVMASPFDGSPKISHGPYP